MTDHVMVIAGEWKMSDDGSWTFSIDEHQMSRIISLAPTTTLLDVGVKNERSEVNERANPAQKLLAGELNHHAGQLAGELNHHVGQLAGELKRRMVILARRAQPSRRSARPASSTITPVSSPKK
ncbi:hypothetical protein DY000_02029842 [Brassica cretica]|uniref:Uncharacterized protein n=1 Tax=Brassica cretica TaxID=69181 RepID=A0ABQ7DJP9_BRACR|nr:hypothetical protein DY000_02029842 [Brassica cretica]